MNWKDGVITLEGHLFMRRITAGSALGGDRVIYHKAEGLEIACRERHGLEDFADEDYDEADRDTGSETPIRSRESRGREYQSKPVRYSNSAKTKTRNRRRYDTSEGSDSESDTAA